MQLLGRDEARLVEEGCQDDWKIKVWRSLVRVLMIGSYLLGATAEFFPPEEAVLPEPGPTSYQLRQGGAELRGEGDQVERRKQGATLEEVNKTQEQAALQQERDQGVGKLDEPEAQAPPLGNQ